MFKKGGSANEGIMHGLVDRSQYAGGGTIGGGTIQGTPMGNRTGFANFAPIGSTVGKTALTGYEGLIGQGMASELADSPAKLKAIEKAKLFSKLRNLSYKGLGTTAGIPMAYVSLAKMLQSSLPDELKSIPNFAYGKKGIYDRAGYADPMSAGANISPEVDEILRKASSKEARINKYNPLGEGRKDPMGSGFYDTPIDQGGGLSKEAAEKRQLKILSDKLGDGSLDDVNIKETIADKRSRISKRAKEFLQIMSPNATKRALIDAATAASEAGQTSTGNTVQDLTNMITAAAKGSGGARDTIDQANILAIQEDIQKGLKTDKVSETDKLFTKYQMAYPIKEGEAPSDYYARILEKMSTGKIPVETKNDYIRVYTSAGKSMKLGLTAWAKKTYGKHKDFGGILDPENLPPLVQGKKYYDPDDDDWKDHKSEITTPPGE